MRLQELITKYREDHDLSQRQFAELCGLSNSYIAMLERDYNPATTRSITPTLPTLKKLADGMGISLTELFSQADNIVVDMLSKDSSTSLADIIKNKDYLELLTNGFQNMPLNVTALQQMGKTPLLGRIACGEPILAEENIEDYVDLPKHINADFALECCGDSMIGAGIRDGDVVYIRQQPEVENGQIAAVLVGDDEATLKRFYFDGTTVQLVAENPKFAPMVFTGEDINKVRVIGRAVAFTHSLV